MLFPTPNLQWWGSEGKNIAPNEDKIFTKKFFSNRNVAVGGNFKQKLVYVVDKLTEKIKQCYI